MREVGCYAILFCCATKILNKNSSDYLTFFNGREVVFSCVFLLTAEKVPLFCH